MLNTVEGIRANMTVATLSVVILTCVIYGYTATGYEEALKLITDTADKICKDIPLEGHGQNVELSGQAKAELSKLVKNLADIGIQGAGKYEQSQYQGLIQKDLTEALKTSTNCKLTVWNDLKKILPDKISESSIPERLPGSYRLVSINGQPAQGEMQITRNSDSEFSFESTLSNNFGILQYQGMITQQRGRWYVHIQDSNDLNAIRRPVANHVTFEGNRLIFRTAEGVDFAFVWAKSVGFPK